MKLTGGGGFLRSVRGAIDDHAAGSANALSAVVVERDRLLAVPDEALVEDVEHLQERHVGRHLVQLVADHLAVLLEVLLRALLGLAPDVEGDLHDYL